jgi:hypothetical protein
VIVNSFIIAHIVKGDLIVTVAFLGDLGSGKTTSCVRLAILTKKIHPQKKMYSNLHLKNYGYIPLDLMDLYLNHQEVRDTIIIIDEIYTMMDCRISGSYRNRIESYFVAMTRKAQADLFVTMQYEMFVDCRLSPFVKVKYIMETIPIKYNVVIDNIQYSYIKPHPYKFKCTVFDDRNSNNPTIKEFIFDGRRWFNEFDTNQYILPPDDIIQRIKIKQMKDKIQYEKLKDQIENGVKNVKKSNKKAKKDKDKDLL